MILSHAHADHDGGAKLLQDTFQGAHLIYGAPDWKAVDESTHHAGGKPKHDMVGTDGMKSPWAMPPFRSSPRPATLQERSPTFLKCGTTASRCASPTPAAPRSRLTRSAEFYDTYIASTQKMEKAAAAYGATALLSNHSEFDNAYFKAHTAASRQPGEAILSMSGRMR